MPILQNAASNVCTSTVQQDLCVGCGMCAGVCPAGNLSMDWNGSGHYHPVDAGRCLTKCHHCIEVCPFQDHPDNEDTLAADLYHNINGIQHRAETGYYLKCFVGYANGGYRERGASGGVTSWILTALLERGEVDHVICVRPNPDPDCLFKYAATSSISDVQSSSKSAYYPVEVSQVIHTVLQQDARYAIVGLPCFLKAIRLAMKRDARLQKRIVTTIGLVCGHLKSKRFSEYMGQHLGYAKSDIRTISFREKNMGMPATELTFSVASSGNQSTLLWSSIYGKTFLSGEFKLRSCIYCDDIFAEVADIACMDAWLPTYLKDSRGTNIVLVRSEKMLQLLEAGMSQGDLILDEISIDQVISSQAGVVRNKRQDLSHRLWMAVRKGHTLMKKRVGPLRPAWLKQQLCVAQEQVRMASHQSLRLLDRGDIKGYERVIGTITLRIFLIKRLSILIHRIQSVVSRIHIR